MSTLSLERIVSVEEPFAAIEPVKFNLMRATILALPVFPLMLRCPDSQNARDVAGPSTKSR